MNRPNHPKLAVLCAIGFSTLTALMIAAGFSNVQATTQNNPATPVKVKTVAMQSTYSYAQRVLARVETVNTSAAGFDIGGLITQVNVDEGATVSAGAVLATLDVERLDARKSELNSALNRAKAEQRLAKLTQTRIARLVDQGLESSQVLDESNARVDVAVAAVAQVEAQLQTLQVEIDKSQLLAPFAATVIQRHVDPGVSVAPGQAVVTLQTNNNLELRASLPAKLATSLSKGDTVAFANGEHTATLDRFVAAQNTQTRTQDALFTVDSANWRGMSGEIINLVVPVDKSAQGMWVPISALSTGIRGMWTVYVIDRSEQAKVTSRLVEIIYTNGQQAYITGALSAGEQLVIEGTQRLVPGQTVAVIEG